MENRKGFIKMKKINSGLSKEEIKELKRIGIEEEDLKVLHILKGNKEGEILNE